MPKLSQLPLITQVSSETYLVVSDNKVAKRLTPSSVSGLTFTNPPSSSTSNGVVGQIAYDASSFYICVATNTWKKTTLTTF